MKLHHPFFIEPYSLVKLEQTKGMDLSKKVLFPSNNNFSRLNDVNFAINNSIISSYVISPTPKMTWSYPLNVFCNIDCMDFMEKQDEKVYVIGMKEYNQFILLALIVKDSKINTTDSDIQVLKLKVDQQINSVKIFNNGDFIVVVYETGKIELIDNNYNELTINNQVKIENLQLEDSNIKVLYCTFFKYNNENKKNLLFLILDNGDSIVYNLVYLNFSNGFVVSNSHRYFLKENENSNIFKFSHSLNYLFKLNLLTKKITCISIINFQEIKSIFLHPEIVGDFKDNDEFINLSKNITFYALSSSQLMISSKTKIQLINFEFESLLDTYESSNINKFDQLYVSHVINHNGKQKLYNMSLVFFITIEKNDLFLNVIKLDLKTNKLVDNLFKGLNGNTNKIFCALPNLFETNIEHNFTFLNDELHEIYDFLKKCSETSDINNWERVVVPYLKNESWDSIKKSLYKITTDITDKSHETKKIYSFQEYDEDNDRAISIIFIEKILNFIFKINKSGNVEFINENFVPEHTLIYLLTNPIYPISFTKGLLVLLNREKYLTLFRQTVITCPYLHINEVIVQFINPRNKIIVFEDLANRIIKKYSTVDVLKNFKLIFHCVSSQSIDNKKLNFNIDELINKLLILQNNINSWYLIELIIDAIGLFSISPLLIDNLTTKINKKISNLTELTCVSSLLNQVFESNYLKKNAHSKKLFKNKSSFSFDKKNTHYTFLDYIFTDPNKNLDFNFSQKFSSYFVEKLEI